MTVYLDVPKGGRIVADTDPLDTQRLDKIREEILDAAGVGKLLDYDEVCRILDISPPTLRRRVHAGVFAPIRPGRRRLIPACQVAAYLAARDQDAREEAEGRAAEAERRKALLRPKGRPEHVIPTRAKRSA